MADDRGDAGATMGTSPPRARDDLMAAVGSHELPASVEPLLDDYDRVVGQRDRFLWRWLHHLFPHFRLSCVAPEHRERVREAKLLASVFVATLDDVAEKCGDRATFDELTKVPFEHQSVDPDRPEVDGSIVAFASHLWDRFELVVREAPRADEFRDIFRFDLRQVLDAIEYCYVANQNLAFLTEEDVWNYDAHNMMLYVYADVDLAHSPSFEMAELPALRPVVGHVQRMARIGNWITTWERELTESDFTSGVVVLALDRGVISADDLRAIRDARTDDAVDAVVDAIRESDVEETFLQRWTEERAAARTYEPAVESVDVADYLDGFETVLEYHLASRGLK